MESKVIFMLSAAVMACFVFVYVTLAVIPPGYVGVIVSMFGNEKGAEERELPVGAHIVAPWKVVYRFPVFEQNHLWEGGQKFTFQTSEGLIVERIYLVGNLHFPASVVKALNAKIEAVQRAQQRENELRESEAEAKKQMAKAHGEAESALIRARAQAESNTVVSQSLTQELIYWQAVQKWNGQLPSALGNHGMMLPFVEGQDIKR